MRHPSPGSCLQLSEYVDAIIINAGDGTHEHPTQALLEMMMTMEYDALGIGNHEFDYGVEPFKKGIYLKYSKIEKLKKIEDIKHKIIKECLKLFKNKINQI